VESKVNAADELLSCQIGLLSHVIDVIHFQLEFMSFFKVEIDIYRSDEGWVQVIIYNFSLAHLHFLACILDKPKNTKAVRLRFLIHVRQILARDAQANHLLKRCGLNLLKVKQINLF